MKLENQEKLVEGKVYSFKVNGKVELTDNKEFVVLSDPLGVKHLLEHKPFIEYHLINQEFIQCRVDKINCTGKIYLEPLHPHYEINQVYPFKLLGFTHHSMTNSPPVQVAVFEDSLKKHILISAGEVTPNLNIGDSQTFRVYKIKEGQVYLSGKLEMEDYSSFTVGQIQNFKIIDRIEKINIEPYYILESEAGLRYHIREKFYEAYGLKPGDTCKCMYIDDGNQRFLEPTHPFYKIGAEYTYKILKTEEILVYPNTKKQAFFLENKYGKPVVLIKEEVNPSRIRNNLVKCSVRAIHKGRLILKYQ